MMTRKVGWLLSALIGLLMAIPVVLIACQSDYSSFIKASVYPVIYGTAIALLLVDKLKAKRIQTNAAVASVCLLLGIALIYQYAYEYPVKLGYEHRDYSYQKANNNQEPDTVEYRQFKESFARLDKEALFSYPVARN